jgi:hypothetical protein
VETVAGDRTESGLIGAGSPLRTPRAAGVAGILFAVLLTVSLVLLRLSIPTGGAVSSVWLRQPARRTSVGIALSLVPFAGIAFLWFIGVIRDRIGDREDRFFATVFLGSGLLFIGMLFTASAVAAGLVAQARLGSATTVDAVALRSATSITLNTYALRMAGLFTSTVATIALRTTIISRWLCITGYVVAFGLLIVIGVSAWVALLFPAWIAALSVEILIARAPAPSAPEDGTG